MRTVRYQVLPGCCPVLSELLPAASDGAVHVYIRSGDNGAAVLTEGEQSGFTGTEYNLAATGL